MIGPGTAVMVASIAAACGQGGDLSRDLPTAAPAAGYRVMKPGALIAQFPPDPLDMSADPLIEQAWDLAVGADEIYVLDTFAKHVLSLDQDANLRAVIGGPGGGPGEFEYAYSIEADPRGGVWVADFRHARLSRFDAEGHLLEEVPVPQLVRGFAVLPHGAVLYRKFHGGTVSLTVQSGGDAVDLAGELPPELAPGDFQSFLAEYDLEFAVVAPDTIIAFWNTDVRAYGAWRIALDIAAARIMDIAPLAFPAWLNERLAAEAEQIEQDSRSGGQRELRPGARRLTVPFSRGVRILEGELWVAPASNAHLTLATTIPLSAADSVSVVARWSDQRPSDCFGLDYAVVGERLVELCTDQVRVYELLPAEPGLLPFAAGRTDP